MRFVMVYFALLVLASCSMHKIIVKNLNWVVMREVNKYFDLSDEQYKYYREKSRAHLDWFKRTQIPWIIADLTKIQQAKEPLPSEYLTTIAEERVPKLWIALADRLADDGAHLFRSLNAEQFDHFEKKLVEDSEVFSKLAALPPKEYTEEFHKLQKETINKMSDWVGDLTDEQKKKFRELTFVKQDQYQKETAIWIEIRREFVRQVKLKVASNDDVAKFLRHWARNPDIEGEKYRQYRKWRLSRQIALWVEMEKTITPKQRAFRTQRMTELINDLKTMQATQY